MQGKKTLFFLTTALLLIVLLFFLTMNKILDRSRSLFDDFQIGKGNGPVKSNAVVLNRWGTTHWESLEIHGVLSIAILVGDKTEWHLTR